MPVYQTVIKVRQYVHSFRYITGIGQTDRQKCHNNIALCHNNIAPDSEFLFTEMGTLKFYDWLIDWCACTGCWCVIDIQQDSVTCARRSWHCPTAASFRWIYRLWSAQASSLLTIRYERPCRSVFTRHIHSIDEVKQGWFGSGTNSRCSSVQAYYVDKGIEDSTEAKQQRASPNLDQYTNYYNLRIMKFQ